MNLTNFFAAIGLIASQQIDPFTLDWEEAHEWRALCDAYLAWQEAQ